MADVQVLAPESYYKKRQALIAKIRLNIVPPTSTMSFVRPQDEAHLKAWIEITEFIGTHDLKELCLVCWHAVIWRVYNKAARDLACEAQAALTKQKILHVKKEKEKGKGKGKATNDTKSQEQEAKATVPDIQELCKMPKPLVQMPAQERQRIQCRFFVAGTCRNGNRCNFGHFEMARDVREAKAAARVLRPSVAAGLYGKY